MDLGQKPPADLTATDRLLIAALPPGWTLLGRARQGSTAPASFPTGCHVLANERVGVALLDIAPGATPNAAARLRRTLGLAGFSARYPGTLPVWHGRIEQNGLHRVPALLEGGFALFPSIALPFGAGWPAALEEALDRDPGWEAAGRPKRGAVPLDPALAQGFEDAGEGEDELPLRAAGRIGGGAGWWRAGRFGLAFAAVFLAGLVSGLLLGALPESGEVAAVHSAPPALPETLAGADAPMPAQEAIASPLTPPPPRLATQEPVPLPVPAAAAEAAPMLQGAPEDGPGAVQAPPPAEEAAAGGPEPVALQGIPPPAAPAPPDMSLPPPPATPEPPAQDAQGGFVPLPPHIAAAPPAPPRPAPRPAALAYDRRCGEAQFRWAQGLPLTAAEMAFVREGCASSAARRR